MKTIQVMALENAVLLPKATVTLNIFEPRYVQMLESSLAGERLFALVNLRNSMPAEVFGVGLIRCSVKNENGTYQLVIEGIARHRIRRIISTDPVLEVESEVMKTEETSGTSIQIRRQIQKHLDDLSALHPPVNSILSELKLSELNHSDFCDAVAGVCCNDYGVLQQLLETASLEKRLTLLLQILDTSL